VKDAVIELRNLVAKVIPRYIVLNTLSPGCISVSNKKIPDINPELDI
jgi:hypothetical protein